MTLFTYGALHYPVSIFGAMTLYKLGIFSLPWALTLGILGVLIGFSFILLGIIKFMYEDETPKIT